MTYDAQETSIEGGQPVELYDFAIGSTHHRYTSSELSLTVSGSPYNPEVTERSQIVQTTDDKSDRIEVRMSSSTSFAQQFKTKPPGSAATFTLYRVHRTDGAAENVVYFKGLIHGVSFSKNGKEAVIAILPVSSAKSQEIPRYTFQNLCNYALFDSDCKVSSAAFTHILPCVTVSGSNITLTGAGALGADYFEGGYVEFDSEFRLVTAQSTDVLTILVEFGSSPLGQNVTARTGCKHRLGLDCDTKFTNAINFGGYNFVPQKNIFETGLS